MKRTLSLVLALVMVLGTFTGVFAAEAQETAVDVLEREGVLLGDGEDLMLDKNLERREAVVLLSRLFDVEDEAKAFEAEGYPTWADVSSDAYFVPFFAWAEVNKYFEGDDEGNFRPREAITAQDYSVVLLRALKYDVSGDAAWRTAFKNAEELGLLADVDVEEKDAILRSEMAVMTFNALGTEMNDSDETLAEFLGIEMPEEEKAKELTANVYDTENLREVVLELSNAELADKDSLENTNNYKVVGYNVEKAELDGDNVIILLGAVAEDEAEALVEGKEYKLRVRSIDKAINKEYKFVARDNTIPAVEEVEVLGKNGIKLKTTEPIKILDTVRGRTFVVDGKNIAMNVESYGRDVILTPYHNETFKDDIETLVITGLEDFAGFRSGREEFSIEMTEDVEGPEVVDVILRGDKKVEVVFDKDIYVETVEAYYNRSNVGNISYQSGRHTVYAEEAKKIDTNKALYTFEDDFLRVRTDFTIVDVENHSGVKMEETTMVAREILDNIEPEIFDSEVRDHNVNGAGTATIRLYFDKDIVGIWDTESDKTLGFDVDEHFRLYDNEVSAKNLSPNNSGAKIESANYVGDREDIIDVKVSGLTVYHAKDNDLEYVLEVEDFRDLSSRSNRMLRDYVDFRFSPSTAFTITGIEVINEDKYETEIRISFNKAVDRFTAEDLTNYIFTPKSGAAKDVKDLKGSIVTEKRGYDVTLKLPGFKVADYNYFRVLDVIKTTSNQRLNRVYTYNFGLGLVDNANYTVEVEDGKYEVTPKTGVNSIVLKTDLEKTFVIKSGLDKLTINAPNATVEIPAGVIVDEVVIVAIKGETLVIDGTVGKVVVQTKELVNIVADANKTFELVSEVEDAEVIVNDTEVELAKNVAKVVKVATDKTVNDELAADVELKEAKEALQTKIDEAKALDSDKVILLAEIEKAEAVVADTKASIEEVEVALANLVKEMANEALLAVESVVESVYNKAAEGTELIEDDLASIELAEEAVEVYGEFAGEVVARIEDLIAKIEAIIEAKEADEE